jgi:hypothetical protein
MAGRRTLALLAVSVALLAAWCVISPGVMAQVAEDQPITACGTDVGGQPVRPRFTVDEPASETDVRIRTSDEKRFSIVLKASCVVEPDRVQLHVDIEPSPEDFKDFPPRLAQSAEVHYRNDGVTVVLPVKREGLTGRYQSLLGTYDGVLVAAASGSPTARVPIRLTVKDRRLFASIGSVILTLLGSVAGVAAAAFMSLSSRDQEFRPVMDTVKELKSEWGFVALLVAIAVNFFWTQGPFQQLVADNDTWEWTAGGAATIVARAFAGGAGTSVATLFIRSSARMSRKQPTPPA